MSEILRGVWEVIVQIFSNSGYAYFFTADGGWKNAVMLVVAFVFLYLGIKKGFEPLLMIPIAFGMLLANIPSANHFRYLPVGTGIVGYDCCGGVLLYGLGAYHSAPHYARADYQERAQRGNGQPAPCFQAGEDFVPHFGNGHCIFAAAGCGCTGGYAHVR